jgi:PucR-like helix-turn-helix protein/diguanylate cyclase with GGDEF domain
MSTVPAESRAEAAEAERRRICTTMMDRVEEIVEESVRAIRDEIPAYRALQEEERFIADVTDQVHKHHVQNLISLLDDRPVTLEQISFVRGAAMRRARAGLALEDYINAYRVGQQNLWDTIVALAGETPEGRAAALTLATPLMRYVDFASTHAGHAYAEFQQYALADADRERRDLLEHLLAGKLPTRGPLLAAAHGYGLRPDAPMLVAAAVPVGPEPDADAPYAASAAIARGGLRELRTLVVVRQSEIVAVAALRADGDAGAQCRRLEALQRRLGEEGTPLAMGVSTVAAGVAELPRAYAEARSALECLVGDGGGVVALPRLSPFGYLALRVDDTARRLVDPRVREFLEEDRARGGVLTATIRAFADADLKINGAAEQLQVHPNTAQYRLRRIEERTGRNPRQIADLLDLLFAIALDRESVRAGP